MESRSMWDNFNMDRAGNSASVLVLQKAALKLNEFYAEGRKS